MPIEVRFTKFGPEKRLQCVNAIEEATSRIGKSKPKIMD
jgi:hypothetical protein